MQKPVLNRNLFLGRVTPDLLGNQRRPARKFAPWEVDESCLQRPRILELWVANFGVTLCNPAMNRYKGDKQEKENTQNGGNEAVHKPYNK